MQKILNKSLIFCLTAILSCAYYNTFFNAKENFNQGVDKQKNVKTEQQVSAEVKKHFDKAIEKSWKLIDIYGDSSKYADDALLLIGQSYYYLQDFPKSERVLEQFILKYTESDLLDHAKLWLAKTYIALQSEEKALDLLNNIFEGKVSNQNAAQAFFILGELYFKKQDYQKAIGNLEKCVEITSDDEIRGNAEYMMGESYSALGQYENAISHFEKLEKLEVSPLLEFEALMQKLNALTHLKKYQEADKILRLMLRDQRFKEQFSIIETKLAYISELQGDIEYAMPLYYEVLKKFPRKEGAALSAYHLAQLYEFKYGNFDSAKTYYENVKKQFANSEMAEEAETRSRLLMDYIKIRDQLLKDRKDFTRLQRGDSTLIDSIALEPEVPDTANLDQQFKMSEDLNISRFQTVQPDTLLADSLRDSLQQTIPQITKPLQKKIAVSRPPEEVEGSLIKNSFSIAEYFLLKYQNVDSAEIAYYNFIMDFKDSTLTPKAYYALYYIYNDIFENTIKADSIKNIILTEYFSSIYGKKLRGEEISENLTVRPEELKSKSPERYLEAENFWTNHDYLGAIRIFQQIAEDDSGSIYAQKSRYAIAYLYEHILADTSKAIDSYALLANEYPNTDLGKFAKKKIAEPPKDEPKPNQNEDIQQDRDQSNLDQKAIEKGLNASTGDVLEKVNALEKEIWEADTSDLKQNSEHESEDLGRSKKEEN